MISVNMHVEFFSIFSLELTFITGYFSQIVLNKNKISLFNEKLKISNSVKQSAISKSQLSKIIIKYWMLHQIFMYAS